MEHAHIATPWTAIHGAAITMQPTLSVQTFMKAPLLRRLSNVVLPDREVHPGSVDQHLELAPELSCFVVALDAHWRDPVVLAADQRIGNIAPVLLADAVFGPTRFVGIVQRLEQQISVTWTVEF